MLRLVCVLGLCAVTATGVGADDTADKGRAVLDKHQPALVTLRAVIQEKYSGPDVGTEQQEYNLELLGTVIAADGLTVAALSNLDPSSLYEDSESLDSDYRIDTQVADVKLVLPGGREIPASVVVRDKDLDLVLVRPRQAPAEPMPYVDLSGGTPARPFDPIVILSRLGKAANRAAYGVVTRVRASVERPRKFFVVGEDTYSLLGAPAFTLDDGRSLGIVALRALGGGIGISEAYAGEGDAVLPVVVPGEDVLKLAAEAAEAAP